MRHIPASHASPVLLVACAVLALVVLSVSMSFASSAQRTHGIMSLSDFLVLYLQSDGELDASLIRLEAARQVMKGKTYLPPPNLRMDVITPDYAWDRSYTYRYYLDSLYTGVLEAERRNYRLALTLKQRLPTGGDLSLKGSASQAKSSFSYSGFPSEIAIERETADRQVLTDVGISLDQPLFGWWERKGEIRRAELQYRRQKAQHLIDAAAAAGRAVDAFFDYMVGASLIGAKDLQLQSARRDAVSAQSQFENGLLSEIDLLEYKIASNNAEIDYYRSRTSLDRAAENLRVFFPAGPSDLVPEDLNTVFGSPDDPDLAASPEVARAAHDVGLARLSLDETRRRRFGQTRFSIWYGLQGLGDDLRKARDQFDENRWGGSVSIGFNLPEPNYASDVGGAEANLKIAQSVLEEARRAALEAQELLRHKVESLQANLELETRRLRLLEDLAATRREQVAEEVLALEDLVALEIEIAEARIARFETMRNLGWAWIDRLVNAGENPLGVLGIKLK